MKTYFFLFLLFSCGLAYSQGPLEGARNSILGIYTGTYQSYDNWPNSPVLPAGVKITALPNDTIGLIAHDTLNNIQDTLFVTFYYDANHQFIVDTALYFWVFHPCGDVYPAADSINYARCLQSNLGDPLGWVSLRATSLTFPTSINNTLNHKFSIYPNPVIDKLNISTDSNNGFKTYCIYTIYGQLVDSGKFNPIVEIDNLPPGMYYLKLIGKTEVTKPFVKGY